VCGTIGRPAIFCIAWPESEVPARLPWPAQGINAKQVLNGFRLRLSSLLHHGF
jgi:hypothetical protein